MPRYLRQLKEQNRYFRAPSHCVRRYPQLGHRVRSVRLDVKLVDAPTTVKARRWAGTTDWTDAVAFFKTRSRIDTGYALANPSGVVDNAVS